MKKKRRIEITAFRRTVTVSAGGPADWPEDPAPQDPDPAQAPAQPRQADLFEVVLSSIDTKSIPDLEHLIEVVASHDDGGDNEN